MSCVQKFKKSHRVEPVFAMCHVIQSMLLQTLLLYITIIIIVGEVYPRTLPGRVDHLQKELKGCAVQIQALSTQLKAQDKDMSALRDEFRLILRELGQTKRAIKDVTELMKT